MLKLKEALFARTKIQKYAKSPMIINTAISHVMIMGYIILTVVWVVGQEFVKQLMLDWSHLRTLIRKNVFMGHIIQS